MPDINEHAIGEICTPCYNKYKCRVQAVEKVEQSFHNPMTHPLTAYVCAKCFSEIMGFARRQENVEIERRYFLKQLPDFTTSTSKTYITQGYLSSAPAVRVRTCRDNQETKAYLTIKGKKLAKSSTAKYEFEKQIHLQDAEELLSMCRYTLNKIRYEIPFEGKTWEVDIFEGRLTGLVIAEIELDNVKQSYALPPWVGDEITSKPQFSNLSLAQCETLPSFPVLS